MKRALLLLLALLAGPATAQAPPPVPALPDSPRLTSYSLSGTTCACSVGWAIYGDGTDVDNWIDVFLNGVSVLSTDPAHGWTLTSPTGSLGAIPRPITNAVLTFAQPQTGTVTIVGARRPRRITQFQENRGVTARDLNQVITDLVAMERERWDAVNTTLRGQPGEVLTPLPSSSGRAGKLLAFDAGGQPIASAQQISIVTNAPIVGGNTLSLTNSAPLPVVDLATSPPLNGFYASGSGAVFSTCPLTYAGNCTSGTMAITYAAQYLKATATRDSTIAEYMVVNDCDLNSGKGGAGVNTFNDNKVCQYNSVTTGANAGLGTWVQANNFVIGANDNNPPPAGTIPFKVTTELDMENNGPDCAPGVKNCFILYLSGLVKNPITSFLTLSATDSGTHSVNSHYGILITGPAGSRLADTADIGDEASGANYGLCFGCVLSTTHNNATIRDSSSAPFGIVLTGAYSTAAISIPSDTKMCLEPTNVACLHWNSTTATIEVGLSLRAPYLGTTVDIISALVPCIASVTGLRHTVSNGNTDPSGIVVSATGTTFRSVICNGAAGQWVYG